MSLNTSHTPDGKGVLIYNGEMILLYTTNIKLKFEKYNVPAFKSTKSGALYLTSHRIIFMSDADRHDFKSFAMPFHCLRDVKLEQPLLAPNYLKGWVQPLPGANFDGCPEWRLSFPKGGCIEFGEALLRAADMASRARPFAAPPAYGSTLQSSHQATYYFAAPTVYMQQGPYQGFQAPTHIFPEQPPAGNVYMYDMPPPYAGIGQTTPYPAGNLQAAGSVQYQYVPPYTTQPPPTHNGAVAAPLPNETNIGGGAAPQQNAFNIGGGAAPQQNAFNIGGGVAPQPSGLPTYQNVPTNEPPPYSAYQEAPPLPSKNGPL